MKTRRKAPVRRPEQRREEILELAIRHFARHGYADADLQVLADDLGMGKGSLYRHFGNKERLFLAVIDRVMHNLMQSIDARLAGVTEPLERIRLAILAYLEYFAANPESVEIFIQERAHFRDRKRPAYFEHREANLEPWRAVYRGLLADGRLRNIPVERMTDVLGDLLYGAMFTNYIADRRRPPDRVAADVIDVILHGILSECERESSARRNGMPHPTGKKPAR